MQIFISYRRADTEVPVGRIFDRMVAKFGVQNVFKDVNSILAGSDFRQAVFQKIATCDVVLVMIGDTWLNVADENGKRRLDNPHDLLRLEIESALKRDDLLVIPVLVNGAKMPTPNMLPENIRQLCDRNAIPMRNDPDFTADMERLLTRLADHERLLVAIQEVIDQIEAAKDELSWEAIVSRLSVRAYQTSEPLYNRKLEHIRQKFQEEREQLVQSLLDSARVNAETSLAGAVTAKKLLDKARHLAVDQLKFAEQSQVVINCIHQREQEAAQHRLSEFLGNEFGFSAEELALNRMGKASERQRRHIDLYPLRLSIGLSGMSIMSLLIGSLIWIAPTPRIQLVSSTTLQPFYIAFLGLGIVGLISMVLLVLRYRWLQKFAPADFRIEQITGRLKLVRHPQSEGEAYKVRINDFSFPISNELWLTLKNLYSDREFRAYVAKSRWVRKPLSIELWDD